MSDLQVVGREGGERERGREGGERERREEEREGGRERDLGGRAARQIFLI